MPHRITMKAVMLAACTFAGVAVSSGAHHAGTGPDISARALAVSPVAVTALAPAAR
ncbi:hypothetical protein [Roseovarius sp. SYSU LYC5161]|uniref:hypothetical protein n=1 Tax=Roseovarius halophilus (ex Wu et al. 2025) TaxID=3376060 RepID=UPI00399B6E28